MTSGIDTDSSPENGPENGIEETATKTGRFMAAIIKPFTWLGGLTSANPGRRQTLNLLLLTVVIPMLLLGVVMVNFLNSSNSSSVDLNPTTRQIDLALERILEAQARALTTIAADPTINGEIGQDSSVVERLAQFHRAHSEFESLARVNAQGEVEATAGILHQDFYLWQNTPAFHDSLNNRDRPYISPLKIGPLSVSKSGAVDLSSSRIERLIFTAGTWESPADNRDGGVIVGIMKTDSLLDSAYRYLQREPAGDADGLTLLSLSREDIFSQQPDSDIQLLSLSPSDRAGITEGPGFEGRRPGDLGGSDSSAAAITPFRDTDSSWYSALQSASAQQNPTISNLTMALATMAVALMLVAGWIILKSPRVQPSVGMLDNPQSHDDVSIAGPAGAGQEISRRLMSVQESVRREMADYLHGHVQSKLVALSMSLGNCQNLLTRDPDRAHRMLGEIQQELQKVQDEDLRQVSRQLYPAIIKMGLIPAIRSLTGRLEDVLDIDLIIDADVFALDSEGEAGIPEKQRLGVYRIAEEALNNIMKHAGARNVEVTLICRENKTLMLSVEDNGCGFDPDDRSNCQGLALMTDYAEAIGGQTRISSTPDQGTIINLSVALDPQYSIPGIAGESQTPFSSPSTT